MVGAIGSAALGLLGAGAVWMQWEHPEALRVVACAVPVVMVALWAWARRA